MTNSHSIVDSIVAGIYIDANGDMSLPAENTAEIIKAIGGYAGDDEYLFETIDDILSFAAFMLVEKNATRLAVELTALVEALIHSIVPENSLIAQKAQERLSRHKDSAVRFNSKFVSPALPAGSGIPDEI